MLFTFYKLRFSLGCDYIFQIQYGVVAWQCVMTAAGCKNMVFNTHKNYSDSLFPSLAKACAEVLQGGNEADYMVFFGR